MAKHRLEKSPSVKSEHTEPLLLSSALREEVKREKPPVQMADMPFLPLPEQEMELFDPDDPSIHLPQKSSLLLPLGMASKIYPNRIFIPRGEDCRALWDAYSMFDNIRAHSQKVACMALGLAQMATAAGCIVNEDLAYAAGMLHDLGKTYGVQFGGNHAQMGAAWVMRETRNGTLAHAVIMHVHWPWEDLLETMACDDRYFATFIIIYADKRVRHDEYVSIDERFEDLQARYGATEEARRHIEGSRQQGKLLEAIFSKRLGRNLDAYTPDCGGLVR